MCVFLGRHKEMTRVPLEARPNGCLSFSGVVHKMFIHRHRRHRCHKVLSVFKEDVCCSTVAQIEQNGGLRIATVAEWMHKVRSMVATYWIRPDFFGQPKQTLTAAIAVPPFCKPSATMPIVLLPSVLPTTYPHLFILFSVHWTWQPGYFIGSWVHTVFCV